MGSPVAGLSASTPSKRALQNVDEPPVEGPQLPPSRKKPRAYPSHVPSCARYLRSYMHKAPVVCMQATARFIAVAALDGTLTLWARQPPVSHHPTDPSSSSSSSLSLHYVKTFRAHTASIDALHLARDDDTLLSLCTFDKSVKLFSLAAFDMRTFVNLSFVPAPTLCTVPHVHLSDLLLVPFADSPTVAVYVLRDLTIPPRLFRVPHRSPLTHLVYNSRFHALISIDNAGVIEYWQLPRRLPNAPHPITEPPAAAAAAAAAAANAPLLEPLYSHSKLRTDLYILKRNNATATSLAVSPTSHHYVCTATDHIVRIFHFQTSLVVSSFDLNLPSPSHSLPETHPLSSLPKQQCDRRIARERALASYPDSFALANAVFDETGVYVIYTSVAGVHVVDALRKTPLAVLGVREPSERFLSVALCPTDSTSETPPPPLLLASSFDSQRVFLFGNHDAPVPMTGRDVFNERPLPKSMRRQMHAAVASTSAPQQKTAPSANEVTLHTSAGDIRLRFVSSQTPKTVENFVTHARNKYYDGVLFHRVIKGFMIQTGDPDGDGTGGESIWGGEFEDEIDESLSHEEGMVSMANSGKNSNGSQFFITCKPCKHLDGKHTIFGKLPTYVRLMMQRKKKQFPFHTLTNTALLFFFFFFHGLT